LFLEVTFEVVKKLLYICMLIFSILSCAKKEPIIDGRSNSQLIKKYAERLQVSESQITNVKLYEFIDDWYGTKYQYGGHTKSGVDCSGFCNLLYNHIYNKELPRSAKDIAKVINQVDQNKLKEGDLLFFNINGKDISHVGLYLTNNYFIHASTSKGVIISSLTNPYYKKTYSKGGGL
jgi:probable lipoprotein NlpC